MSNLKCVPMGIKAGFFLIALSLISFGPWARFIFYSAAAEDLASPDENSPSPSKHSATHLEKTISEPLYQSPDKKHKLRGKAQHRAQEGRVISEKEAEGTEAPRRFNPDINIKSKYEFHGQPIEVDTD